jgi:hypothetical protein
VRISRLAIIQQLALDTLHCLTLQKVLITRGEIHMGLSPLQKEKETKQIRRSVLLGETNGLKLDQVCVGGHGLVL